MVFSVRTFNNINQIGLKELGNKFQIDGDHAEIQMPLLFDLKICMDLIFLKI